MAQRLSNPRVTTLLIPSAQARDVEAKVTTIIGQKTSSGSATEKTLYQDVTEDQYEGLFGEDSQVADLYRNFRKVNGVSQVNVIPLDDNGVVYATGNVDFTGSTATEAGVLNIYVGSKNTYHKAVVNIASADDATTIGDAFVTALTSLTKSLVSGVNTLGDVELTAVNSGTVSNDIGIMVEGSVAGVTVALTAMSGGTTNPTLTGVTDLISYRTDIVMPYELGIGDFETLLENRFNIENNVLDGELFTAITDTKSNLETIGDAKNEKVTVIFGDAPIATSTITGSAIFEMPTNKAAQFAGLRALRLNSGSDISGIVVTSEPKDQKGGPGSSSLPYFNTPTTFPIIPLGEGFDDSDVADLKDSGISVMGNNDARNTIICGEVVTTYKTNAASVADPTFKFLNYVDSGSISREYIWRNLKSDYAQKRMTSGEGQVGYSFATKGGVRRDAVRYYTELTLAPYITLQGGLIEDTGKTVGDFFKESLTVEFDFVNGEIDIASILPLNTQVRDIFYPLSIKFNPAK